MAVGECVALACLDPAVTGFGVAPSAQGLHSASIPGILALDLCPSDTNKILTGEKRPGLEGARSCSHMGLGQRGLGHRDLEGSDSFGDLIWVLCRWGG